MSRKKRKSPRPNRVLEPVNARRAKKVLNLALPVLLTVSLAIVGYLGFFSETKPPTSIVSTSTFNVIPKLTRKHQSLEDLLKMTPDHLARVDIARMNLLCATGLASADKLDLDGCLARLDEWAAHVRYETKRHLYRAHDPRWADHYKHSENWLRAEMLAQVLQEDWGSITTWSASGTSTSPTPRTCLSTG